MPDPPTADATSSARRPSFIEQARRTQIIQAAIETIAHVGFANASFARIAERAGISPGLISYHFGNRAELVNAVVAHISANLEASIEAAAEGAESYTVALRALIEAHVGFTASNTIEAVALMQIYTALPEDDGSRPTRAERSGWIDELESMIREGQDEGEFSPFDPRPMAVTLLAALESAPAELHSRPGADPAAYARELADLFEAATKRPTRRRTRR